MVKRVLVIFIVLLALLLTSCSQNEQTLKGVGEGTIYLTLTRGTSDGSIQSLSESTSTQWISSAGEVSAQSETPRDVYTVLNNLQGYLVRVLGPSEEEIYCKYHMFEDGKDEELIKIDLPISSKYIVYLLALGPNLGTESNPEYLLLGSGQGGVSYLYSGEIRKIYVPMLSYKYNISSGYNMNEQQVVSVTAFGWFLADIIDQTESDCKLYWANYPQNGEGFSELYKTREGLAADAVNNPENYYPPDYYPTDPNYEYEFNFISCEFLQSNIPYQDIYIQLKLKLKEEWNLNGHIVFVVPGYAIENIEDIVDMVRINRPV